MLDWGISLEESIHNKEDRVQEGPALDCSAVTGALGVFAWPEADVEYQLDQVGYMSGFGVGFGDRCSHDGVDNSEGDGLFLFDRRVLDAIGFNPTDEASVHSSVGLGVWRLSRVEEAIQDVGRRNCPPCLRK